MYTSLLGENDLQPNVIKMLTSDNQEDSEVDLTWPLIDTAATMSVNDLVRQVDTQLFYNEKLGSKLLRRLSK